MEPKTETDVAVDTPAAIESQQLEVAPLEEPPAPDVAIDIPQVVPLDALPEPMLLEVGEDDLLPSADPMALEEASASAPTPESGAPIDVQPLQIMRSVDEEQEEAEDDGGAELAQSEAASISAEAQSITATLAATGAATITNVNTTVTTLTAQAKSEAETAKSEIETAYTQQIDALSAQVADAIAEVEAMQTAQLAQINTVAATQRDQFQTHYETQCSDATAFVEALRADIIETGESEAQRASDESEARATAIVDEANGQSFGGDADLVEAQQKAVRDMQKKQRANAAPQGMTRRLRCVMRPRCKQTVMMNLYKNI